MSCTDTHVMSVRIHGMAMQWERDAKLYYTMLLGACLSVCMHICLVTQKDI